jgi:hypothetical protein
MGSLLGNILAGAKEIERPTSTDEFLAHIANQTGNRSAFFIRSSPYEQGKIAPILLRSMAVRFVASAFEILARPSRSIRRSSG